MTTHTPAILYFTDINACHAAMGFTGRTDLPDFHIFTLEETYPSTLTTMPPYAFNFYGMGLHEAATDAHLEMNAAPIYHQNTLTFQAPGNVVSWRRGARERGFILYFHRSFVQHLVPHFVETFALFRPTTCTTIPVQPTEQIDLHQQLARLHQLFHLPHPYRVARLQHALLEVLYTCQALYERDIVQPAAAGAAPMPLVAQFQALIDAHFHKEQRVKAYAAMLGVTPNHLSQVVSATVGQRAYDLIMARVALEAKNLLCYSDQSVTEIAVTLGFREVAHFTRFVKRQFGLAPLAYRQHLRGQALPHRAPANGSLSPRK